LKAAGTNQPMSSPTMAKRMSSTVSMVFLLGFNASGL
jgi:hypothetical protein